MSKKKLFLLISIILFLSFVYFSYLVSKERFIQFDFDTTVKLQDHISRKLDLPFSLLSILGSVEVTGFIWLILLIFLFLKRYWLTIAGFFLFWAAMAFEIFGKVFLYHPGPPFLLYRGVIKFDFPSSYAHTAYSYPSGHLTRTSFLASFLIVLLYLKAPVKLRLPLQLLIIAFWFSMLVSRVYLGEHWTTDVLGGLLLGTSVGILTSSTIPLRKKINVQLNDNTT